MQKISFLINIGPDTLSHTKLLLKSLQENLASDEHEILIFVDKDTDGSLEYLRSVKSQFKDLNIITHTINPLVGYSRNSNILVEKAKHDIVSYLQTDMVICPEYDKLILQQIEPNCILSATRVEPPLHGESKYTITQDFGMDPDEFDLNKWNEFSKNVMTSEEISYFFAPFTFYKDVWLKVGGYDTLFRRSREDSDILQRFIQSGVKIKQSFSVNVFHFTCITSRGKHWHNLNDDHAAERIRMQERADQIELRNFIRKWGAFSHEPNLKLRKYDIELFLDMTKINLNHVIYMEPYFSKIYVKNSHIKDLILQQLKSENSYQLANDMMGFSHEDWEFASKFYRQITDFTDKIEIGVPENYNILMTLKSDMNSEFTSYLPMLNSILFHNKILPGHKYVFGNGQMSFNELVDITPNYIVENPTFDYSLIKFE